MKNFSSLEARSLAGKDAVVAAPVTQEEGREHGQHRRDNRSRERTKMEPVREGGARDLDDIPAEPRSQGPAEAHDPTQALPAQKGR
jgi:hypothetical protein